MGIDLQGWMDENDLDQAMTYYGDITAIIYGDTPCRIPDTLAQGLYEFESHDRLYECTGFEGHWQVKEPEY